MTRKQAIRELKIQFVGEYDRQREAKDMAIKALEQEPVLDKIRAEIEELKEGRYFSNYDMHIYKTCLKDAIDIIDKYKAESDEKDEEGE